MNNPIPKSLYVLAAAGALATSACSEPKPLSDDSFVNYVFTDAKTLDTTWVYDPDAPVGPTIERTLTSGTKSLVDICKFDRRSKGVSGAVVQDLRYVQRDTADSTRDRISSNTAVCERIRDAYLAR